MRTGFGLVILFIVSITVFSIAIYMYYMPYESWIALGNILKFLMYLVIAYFIIRIVSRSSGSRHSHSITIENSLSETGDRLDPNTVRELSGHAFEVKSIKGRKFIVAKGRNDLAGFQEVDKHGYKIGSPVVATSDMWRFGKEPNKALAEHMKHKVEDVLSQNYEDYYYDEY